MRPVVIGVTLGVIVAALVGTLALANGPANDATTGIEHTSTNGSGTSVATATTSQSATAETSSSASTILLCYRGSLPTNASATTEGGTSTSVLNETQNWGSGGWATTSFQAFPYGFEVSVAQPPPGQQNLWPEFSITAYTVSDSMARASQTINVTDFGGWSGQNWPPNIQSELTFFSGNAMLRWLFLCDGHSVYLEGIAQLPSNNVAATVTVTQTITTQAAQTSTTYRDTCPNTAPTATTTVTVTSIYGASTTTTVTTTQTVTTYTKTATITSCTYVMPTVTSTVTSTTELVPSGS